MKTFWRSSKMSSNDSTGSESSTHSKSQRLQQLQLSPVYNKPTCSLPLLQVWPSQVRFLFSQLIFQFINIIYFTIMKMKMIYTEKCIIYFHEKDSPSGEADALSFVFKNSVDEFKSSTNGSERHDLSFSDQLHGGDSGIDSTQASPSPHTVNSLPPNRSPSPPLNNGNKWITSKQMDNGHKQRRPSSALLHPDDARLLPLQGRYQTSSIQTSTEELTEHFSNCNVNNQNAESSHTFYFHTPSTASSMTSMSSINGLGRNDQYVSFW